MDKVLAEGQRAITSARPANGLARLVDAEFTEKRDESSQISGLVAIRALLPRKVVERGLLRHPIASVAVLQVLSVPRKGA